MDGDAAIPPTAEAYLEIVDRVLGEESVEDALAHAVRAFARFGSADVAAVLLVEGSECVLEAWHPDDPGKRERHRPSFLTAAIRACGHAAGVRALAAGDGVQVIPLAPNGRAIGAVCLSTGPAAATGPGQAFVHRLARVVASVAATQREARRAGATRREYERWFRTLDEQVRVLERERQKFAAIVHQSDAEVFVADRAQLIRWTNSVLASHPPPGPAGGSWIGQGCRAVCSRFGSLEGAPECGECPVTRAMVRNEVVHHEFRRTTHAESRSLYASALPIKGPDGSPHEVLVMIQDLSDLQVLRRSEARYRLLFERSAKAIVMVDQETRRIVMANPMASRMTGHEAEALLGRSLADLHPPEEWPRLNEFYRRGLAEGNLAPFECRVRTREALDRLAQVSGTRYDLDGQEVLMLELQDVTESRRVQEALRKAEQRLRSVVANAPVVLFAIDEAGEITLSEGRGLEALGWAQGQVVGCSIYELYRDTPQILDHIRRAMAGEEFMSTVEIGGLAFETWYGPLQGPDGRPGGVIGVATDVSQRRRLEDELRQAQKMEAIGRLAGGVAHDFNNLLAAIMGHAELMMRRLDAAHPLHRHAESVLKASTRGALLTRQLLAFSRKEVLTPRVLDVHTVIAEMEEMLRRLIGEHIELVIVLGERPVQVRADRGQLEQVIMNLAVNARDAMAAGGLLTIEVASMHQSTEAVAGPRNAGAYVTIVVSDTGCGMDASTAARIFEPFFTTKDQGKGTGLGLSTVYGIVEQSGGHIDVESQPGAGATFTVYLPRVEEDAAAPGGEGPASTAARGCETVLLAEDEPAVRAMACEALQSHGYAVLEARNGVEALALAQAHRGPLHLLVTDVVMPQMGGGELSRRLLDQRPGLRVLYMSGYTDDAVVRQGIYEATSAFLQKPFSIGAFARKVRETLDAAPAGTADDVEPPARAA
jgi:two-component system, cell cycle sensor histidine kinase and response regulator CckA